MPGTGRKKTVAGTFLQLHVFKILTKKEIDIMAEITLADYVGFIFSEITRARDHADRVSKDIALVYAQDEILKHFSVPRFKIPEMEITVPVLITGARFTTALVFNLSQEKFASIVTDKVNKAMQTIAINKNGFIRDIFVIKDFDTKFVVRPDVVIRPTPVRSSARGKTPLKAEGDPDRILAFYDDLKNNLDPSNPDNLVQIRFANIFNKNLEERKLTDDYKKQNPNNELFIKTTNELIAIVKQNTVVSSTKIENLLVNPETNAVNNGSTESTVFTIKAKIVEDGIFIKNIIDPDTQKESKIVEFD